MRIDYSNMTAIILVMRGNLPHVFERLLFSLQLSTRGLDVKGSSVPE
jgi:hypothetical protein